MHLILFVELEELVGEDSPVEVDRVLVLRRSILLQILVLIVFELNKIILVVIGTSVFLFDFFLLKHVLFILRGFIFWLFGLLYLRRFWRDEMP